MDASIPIATYHLNFTIFIILVYSYSTVMKNLKCEIPKGENSSQLISSQVHWGCLESVEWNGGMEYWNGILEWTVTRSLRLYAI